MFYLVFFEMIFNRHKLKHIHLLRPSTLTSALVLPVAFHAARNCECAGVAVRQRTPTPSMLRVYASCFSMFNDVKHIIIRWGGRRGEKRF